MNAKLPSSQADRDPQETHEWRQAIADVVRDEGSGRARQLIRETARGAQIAGASVPPFLSSPYINTLSPSEEPAYPGDLHIERRIRAINRWNAVAMVGRANKNFSGLGGHMSSYASSANLYEMGFNHFFRGPGEGGHQADHVYYQGHAVPGMYARAFLEGRLDTNHLDHFRRELSGRGLSSYPHPWLMPDFWQFPTVSMGLGPIHAIYQARFNRYLQNRDIKDTSQQRVWAFLGDGECDEVESLGALTLASREQLNNLTFVINCNLQRLDGPVRGNHKIIQELESVFTGAGWNVLKVIWGEEWDPLLAADTDGALVTRMGELVDGEYQKFTVGGGKAVREQLFGQSPEMLARVAHLSDAQLGAMRRGGHSDVKLHAAYANAVASDRPTCILAKTVKGWTLGDGFEASNVTHQMKKMDKTQLARLAERLELPLTEAQISDAAYYKPEANSEEMQYLRARREALGGSLPYRQKRKGPPVTPETSCFTEFRQGAKQGQTASTTMAFVRLLRNLMRDKTFGKYVVPIVPDEARTFGMDPFFREFGIYAAHGQKYVPVDSNVLLHYHEVQNGQLLEEGITEAGAMSSLMAASTAHATHGVPTIPFYLFYSMFGLQRTGDQVWSVGDARGRGFMLGATAGRTTLHGEGLQHNDGHSHLFALAYPHIRAYDPAYAYETAIIVEDGLKRMLQSEEDCLYYITLYNENVSMRPIPDRAGVEEGIIRGIYLLEPGQKGKLKCQILASGPMVAQALLAQAYLQEHHDVSADIYSVTSYQQLYRDGRAHRRQTRLAPWDKAQKPFLTSVLEKAAGPSVAVSDFVDEMPSLVSEFVPHRLVVLGTNGFGRSDTRENLRNHFEIDCDHIVYGCLSALFQDGKIAVKTLKAAAKKLKITADKQDPQTA